jgi:hypothetical protein
MSANEEFKDMMTVDKGKMSQLEADNKQMEQKVVS